MNFIASLHDEELKPFKIVSQSPCLDYSFLSPEQFFTESRRLTLKLPLPNCPIIFYDENGLRTRRRGGTITNPLCSFLNPVLHLPLNLLPHLAVHTWSFDVGSHLFAKMKWKNLFRILLNVLLELSYAKSFPETCRAATWIVIFMITNGDSGASEMHSAVHLAHLVSALLCLNKSFQFEVYRRSLQNKKMIRSVLACFLGNKLKKLPISTIFIRMTIVRLSNVCRRFLMWSVRFSKTFLSFEWFN